MTQPKKELGCGIACVSMITGESYESLKQALKMKWKEKKKKIEKNNFRTSCTDLSSILKNIKHDKEKYSSIKEILHPSIIGVNNKNGNYHWVFAFRKNKELFIADTETGELYRYKNWKDDYVLHEKNSCIVFTGMNIDCVSL